MNLYVRLVFVLIQSLFAPRRGILDESRLRFHSLPHDCDINFHVTNARYLSFMDLGRLHLTGQLRLLGRILRRRWMPVLRSAEVTFIRPIKPWKSFELVTRVISWDEKYIYMEQRLEGSGVLYAVGLMKGLFLNGGAKVPTAEILGFLGTVCDPPVAP